MPPLPQIDSQSFTRLTTTLRLLFCALAIAVPSVVLRDTEALRVSKKELAGLTEVGRAEIERRQRVGRRLGEGAWYIGGAFGVVGVAFLVYSLPRLRKQEAKHDRLTDAELEKIIREQAPDVRDAVLAREAGEEVLAAAAAEPVLGVREETGPQHEDQVETGLPETAPDLEPVPDLMVALKASIDAVKSRFEGVETAVLDRVAQIIPPTFKMKRLAAIGGELEFDALLVSDIDQIPDVVIEIKIGSARALSDRVRMATDQAIALVARYGSRTGREAVPWMILVATDTDAKAEWRTQVQKRWKADIAGHLSAVSSTAIDELQLPAGLD